MLNYRLWMLDYELKIVGLRRSVGADDFAMLKHCPTRIM